MTFVGSYVDRGHRWEENEHRKTVLTLLLLVTQRSQQWTLDLGTSAAEPSRRPTDRTAAVAGCWQLTYSNPLRRQSPRWSAKHDKCSTGWRAQRDRHGAFKPKRRFARFQLVCYN